MIWVSWVFTAIAAVLALGTVAWQAPWVGLFGSLGGYVPGWLLVFAGVGLLTGGGSWAIDPSVTAAVSMLLSLLAAIVGVRVIVDQSRALAAVGVTTRAGDFFGPYRGAKAGPDEVVTYGPVDGHVARMGIYRPRPAETPAPVVVHVHGGGWEAGDESSDSRIVRQLTERGYLVFTPSYTHAAEGTPTWELAPRQIARAIVEMQEHAVRLGGAPQRIYVTGSSAGGQLAALVANQIAAGESLGQEADALPTVVAMLLLIPALDPSIGESNGNVPAGSVAKRLVRGYVGGTTDEYPERYAAVDATGHLGPSSPPALIVYGPNDWLVPSQASIAYVLRSRQLGVDVQSVAIPWTGHLMGLSGAAGRALSELGAAWFAKHPA